MDVLKVFLLIFHICLHGKIMFICQILLLMSIPSIEERLTNLEQLVSHLTKENEELSKWLADNLNRDGTLKFENLSGQTAIQKKVEQDKNNKYIEEKQAQNQKTDTNTTKSAPEVQENRKPVTKIKYSKSTANKVKVVESDSDELQF